MARTHKALLALLLISSLAAGLHLYLSGLEVTRWDDAEYLTFGIDTYDHLAANGLLSWPFYMANSQHYGKPPLYVNTLAAALGFIGRNHVFSAAAAVAGLTALLLALSVFVLIRREAGAGFAILAAAAVTSLPCVTSWNALAFPDVQLVVCVVLFILILAWEEGAVPRRAVLLGAVAGLGMLAKITFAAYAGFPALYWWLSPGASALDRRRRAALLAIAGAIALAVCGVWYRVNYRDAILYASESYGFRMKSDASIARNVSDWIGTMVGAGFGYVFLAGAAAVSLACLFQGARKRPRSRVVAMCVLSGLPALLAALPNPAPNTRHPLASLVVLAIAALAAIFQLVKQSRRPAIGFGILAFTSALMWIAGTMVHIPGVPTKARNSAALRSLMPGHASLLPVDVQAVNRLLDYLGTRTRDGGETVYITGEDGGFNVSRLQLAAKTRGFKTRFQWAAYFTWTEEQCRSTIQRIASSDAVVAAFDPHARYSETEYMNRRQKIALDAINSTSIGGRQVWAEERPGYSLDVFETDSAGRRLRTEFAPVFATFGDRLLLTGAAIQDRRLILEVGSKRKVAVNYSLLLHARPRRGGSRMLVWDRPIYPPLTTWAPGETRRLEFDLPPAPSLDDVVLDLGFFDEADGAHGWPPLRLKDGSAVLTVDPSRLFGDCRAPARAAP